MMLPCSAWRGCQVHRRDDGWRVGIDQLQDLCSAAAAGEIGTAGTHRHGAESRSIPFDCQLQGREYCKVSTFILYGNDNNNRIIFDI